MRIQKLILFASVLITILFSSCSGSTPPDSLLNSMVIARPGIDDFGHLKVRDLVDTIEKFTKKNGGKIMGWSQNNGVYFFTVQQPNTPVGSIAFQVLGDGVVLIYAPDRPNPISMIQTVRVIIRSVYPQN